LSDTEICTVSEASEKLGYTVVHVVLENDGTEIDGDDELLAFAGETLLGLQEAEMWLPAVAETLAIGDMDTSSSQAGMLEMQTPSSDENSVRLSVCLSNA